LQQFELQLTYQPYKVYVHKSWTQQERQCIAQAVYAHLDIWFAFRGYLLVIPKSGVIFIYGKDTKFLNSPTTTSVQSYYDGVAEIHITAGSHKLPGLVSEIERHQNVEKITTQLIPSIVNGKPAYLPSPQFAAWQQNMLLLEDYSSQIADIYQFGTPCPYDRRK
jgi:hypothetical protein